LAKPPRDGDTAMHILTNLPARVRAKTIARLYPKRCSIAKALQERTVALQGEGNTLAYPKAALFGFCVAVLAFPGLAVSKAALRAVPGEEKIDASLSTYSLADAMAGTHRGMMIAIPDKHWPVCATMSPAQFANVWKALAQKVDGAKVKKQPRGPKKPPPRRQRSKRVTHGATSKLLAKR
jgi:hypothetical protein